MHRQRKQVTQEKEDRSDKLKRKKKRSVNEV